MNDAQIKALIARGIADALAEPDADRSRNGDDSHDSGGDERRRMPVAYGTVGHDVAYAMTWTNLKKMMTDKYCPRGKINKLEVEMWNVKVKDKKISTLAERQAENKRKLDNNNQAQQQPPKKQGVSIAYTVGPGKRKEYGETLPSPATTNNHKNPTFYECGNQGHYRSDYPELKNQNHENQAGGTRARGMVHALRGGETNQDLNNMEDDINA
nr:putative reverse transcriptase domain-containing protein [Tanacetum cinerariifolium]